MSRNPINSRPNPRDLRWIKAKRNRAVRGAATDVSAVGGRDLSYMWIGLPCTAIAASFSASAWVGCA